MSEQAPEGGSDSGPAPRLDRSLVAPARAGDREAGAELARTTGRAAYVFALQLSGDPDAAADIAQHSVLAFLQGLDRFDPARPIEPWLYQIVRNRTRDLARRRRHRRHESLDTWLEQEGVPATDRTVDPTAGPNADPAITAERNDLRHQVWRAVSQLSVAHREIFLLRDHHGLSYREISQTLSIPEGTVMSRLHAARRSLRSLLTDPALTDPPTDPTDPEAGSAR